MPDQPRMLVPFDGSRPAGQLLRVTCQAARREHVPLVVLSVISVPTGRAADELPPDGQARVMRTIAQAIEICRAEGVIANFRETYATDLAAEILRVAQDIKATLIAMPLDEWSDDHDPQPISPTVQEVLTDAPCTVLLGAGTTNPSPRARGEVG